MTDLTVHFLVETLPQPGDNIFNINLQYSKNEIRFQINGGSVFTDPNSYNFDLQTAGVRLSDVGHLLTFLRVTGLSAFTI